MFRFRLRIAAERAAEEHSCFFSKNRIILLFKKQYGITPISYITELRIRKAKQLMESTSDGLQSIAEQCGFYDYSQFYKAFYQAERFSPAAWREQMRTSLIAFSHEKENIAFHVTGNVLETEKG